MQNRERAFSEKEYEGTIEVAVKIRELQCSACGAELSRKVFNQDGGLISTKVRKVYRLGPVALQGPDSPDSGILLCENCYHRVIKDLGLEAKA